MYVIINIIALKERKINILYQLQKAEQQQNKRSFTCPLKKLYEANNYDKSSKNESTVKDTYDEITKCDEETCVLPFSFFFSPF